MHALIPRRWLCALVLIVSSGAFTFAAESAQAPGIPLLPGLGVHTRPITTKSPQAQKYFDQGMNLLFGFAHGNESLARFGAWTLPLRWLLTWAPLIAATAWLIARAPRWMASGLRQYARPALTGLLLGLSLAGIATEPFSFLVLGSESWGFNLNFWALFPLLSIALAAFAAYGAFRVRSAGLLGFAILAALVHLSRFYYLYGTSLLWKSLIMCLMGAGLLALGSWFQRRNVGNT